MFFIFILKEDIIITKRLLEKITYWTKVKMMKIISNENFNRWKFGTQMLLHVRHFLQPKMLCSIEIQLIAFSLLLKAIWKNLYDSRKKVQLKEKKINITWPGYLLSSLEHRDSSADPKTSRKIPLIDPEPSTNENLIYCLSRYCVE